MSDFELKTEQRQAIYDHDGTDVIVSASAGSGKTFVMIERLIRLILAKKLSVNELLAVTFTEKAAGEMKEKLTSAIIKSINSGNKELKEELLDLNMADICTIDAFCSRLVKRYFYHLDISRDFEIISDYDAFRLKTEALKLTFDKYYATKLPEFLRVVDRFSKYRKDTELRDYIIKIYQIANIEADPNAWLDKTLFYYTEQGLEKLEDDYLKTIKSKIKVQIATAKLLKDKALGEGILPYADNMQLIIDEMTGLLSYKNIYDFNGIELELGGNIPSVDTTEDLAEFKKVFQAERNKVKNNVKALIASIGTKTDERTRVLSTKDDYLVITMLVKDFANNYFNLKKEENKFDFADISRFALQLLKNEEVGKAVREKYKNIFIDEYQDVNGVQEEIFSHLAKDNEFMVGDVKQSIYGFRGCNPDLFDTKQKAFDVENKAIKLNYNFRSAPIILDRVNDIFDGIMLEDNFGID
ncbi:MAG: UvrD-helicase domain-containing protein [Clostridia bacterium]|nr:UvrD-helicase domain-containing protein [Clostridia bacterium]